MTLLTDLHVGQTGIVNKIDAEDELKSRLYSLGIHKGVSFSVEALSLTKQTIKIKIGSTLIALRNEEAKTIKVTQ